MAVRGSLRGHDTVVMMMWPRHARENVPQPACPYHSSILLTTAVWRDGGLRLGGVAAGWNSNANIMWVDQPCGTGFSYGDDADFVKNEDEVAEDLYQFLQAFLAANEALQGREFFVFGESYGGHCECGRREGALVVAFLCGLERGMLTSCPPSSRTVVGHACPVAGCLTICAACRTGRRARHGLSHLPGRQ
jgi:hypothetical protein